MKRIKHFKIVFLLRGFIHSGAMLSSSRTQFFTILCQMVSRMIKTTTPGRPKIRTDNRCRRNNKRSRYCSPSYIPIINSFVFGMRSFKTITNSLKFLVNTFWFELATCHRDMIAPPGGIGNNAVALFDNFEIRLRSASDQGIA